MSGQHNKYERRTIRHYRVRKRISGTPECPRLSVYRSERHIYAQLIDDVGGQTLTFASSRESLDGRVDGKGKAAISFAVGKLIAERAKEKGVSRVCFDRGGNLYHGRVRAVADAARKAGLEF